jgi:hypothetical protein
MESGSGSSIAWAALAFSNRRPASVNLSSLPDVSLYSAFDKPRGLT